MRGNLPTLPRYSKIGQIEHLLRDCVQQAAVDAQAPDCEALAHIEHRNLPVAVVLPSRRA